MRPDRPRHTIITACAALDALLHMHATELGRDFTAYKNHTYRVLNLCVALSRGGPEEVEKIAIAAAFHDLGIWTDATFDYLQPSVSLASAYLAESGKTEWDREITQMILQHHKISRHRDDRYALVEPFRQADWIDVSLGLRTFALTRTTVRGIFATWPNAGFHSRLMQLQVARLRTHPFSPLPMMRL